MLYSIIIPHFRSPRMLRRALNSVPVRDDVEIIVVDDNSGDEYFKSMSNLMQKKRCVDMLESFFSQQNEDFSNFLNSIKLRVKIYALPDLSLFRSFYPEVNRLIKTRKDLPWPYRIVTYWASIGLYWPYRLYSSLSRLK